MRQKHIIRLWGPAWFLYPFVLTILALAGTGAVTVVGWFT